MGQAPTVGHYVFEGVPLQQKYEWMHTGQGAEAAAYAHDMVSQLAAEMTKSGDKVRGVLGGLAGSWSGQAATSAGEAMSRGTGEIAQAASGTTSAGRCVVELGESFSTAKRNVPAPNEVPTGMGDVFLYAGAEVVKAGSFGVFEPQSPLHEAMEQRGELDRQANIALTNHMNGSRSSVESMPAVAAPAPMAVSTAPAASGSGSGGGAVQQPAGEVPSVGGGGSSPVGTGTQGAAAAQGTPVSSAPAASAGVGGGAAAGAGGAAGGVAPGVVTPGAGTAGAGGRAAGSRPGGVSATGGGAASGAGGVSGVGGAGGYRSGFGGSGVRGGYSGAGAGRVFGGDGGAGRGGTGGVRGAADGAATGRAAAGPSGGRGAGGPVMGAPMGGRGAGGGDDDTEHHNQYAEPDNEIVGTLSDASPAVIGETLYEQQRRFEREREQGQDGTQE